MIELQAYAADCRLFGLVDLGDGRLTDVLNATPGRRLRTHATRVVVDLGPYRGAVDLTGTL